MTAASVPQGITEADIADYLVQTPAFFERHAELLASVQLTSPHGQRAVSLQERQMEMLRERIKGLEKKIVEMIRNGQDNMAIADRLHRWTRALMLTADAAAVPEVLVRELKQQFLVPQAALRVWGVDPAHAGAAFATGVSDDAKAFADGLAQPYCGASSGVEALRWLDDAATVASIALVPLRRSTANGAFGLLALGSPDPTRFAADMATDFLARIGEVASAALVRLLPRT
ncbi:MAG: DUF484 family protein [Aquincola sp.]|nr:DUF484 family protein [Aquincola sp.]